MMVVHSCRKLRRDTPQAFGCCSIAGFDVPVWWGTQPTSVSDRSGASAGSADGFIVREQVLVSASYDRAVTCVTPYGDSCWSHGSLLISAPRPLRNVASTSIFIAAIGTSKAVVGITTRSDSRPRRSEQN